MTITVTETLTATHCPKCDILFAFPQAFENRRRSDRQSFCCPAGHSQWFPGETDKQLRIDAEREAANAREEARIARIDAAQAKREATKLRKAATTATKRARAALCPVPGCKRSFVQMERHLHSRHPEYAHTV